MGSEGRASARRRYVEETVRVWLGLPARADVPAPVLPEPLERRFLRLEEYERTARDAWGCWDFTYSENDVEGVLAVPEIDQWVGEQRGALAEVTPLEPLWPAGRRFAACLTHDVDVLSRHSTPRQVARHALGGLDRGGRGGAIALARPPVRVVRSLRAGISRAPSLAETRERSVGLEADYDAAASYFFTVPASGGGSRFDCAYAPADPCTFRGRRTVVSEVMRTIAAEGFDVGLHGSYHSASEPRMLEAERDRLERATGLHVTTTRQHFLHWDVRWTPKLQERAGFLADSSLGFNRAAGFRASTGLPFRHFDVSVGRPLGVLEVPLVIEDSALLGPIGVASDLDDARAAVRRLIDAVADVGGAVTLLFHPDKLARPDWLALFEWSLAYLSERGGWLTSVAELERWWTAREQKLLAG